ncbi:GNAT family N-acetyltransferase [Brevibacterium permense]|uniref:GNAT family N-acetyltransferase n=1 Tax=Brevibacterium permense TaxID=234834 RepID=UPI0021CE0547|nr:GNAT family N-acetyltransferase [Brevibacterium permense]MCU4297378.1 GNAT family N-acetyltransferase [Brevibacterium permense]
MVETAWMARRDEPVPEEVERLLATVPEWFGRPESNAEYIADARTMETWTVRDAKGRVVGVTLVAHHFPQSSEIHLAVVDREVHGGGIGSAMVEAVRADLRERGTRLLEVKTLGPSHSDPHYARTRCFYQKMGFLPVEETDLWGESTPCLIMIMPLRQGADPSVQEEQQEKNSAT